MMDNCIQCGIDISNLRISRLKCVRCEPLSPEERLELEMDDEWEDE